MEWITASWTTVGMVAVSCIAMYTTLLISVRLAGRRTLAQMSAFDVLVTVALGTLLSSTVLSADPSLVQGIVATVTLLALQTLLALVRRRWPASRVALDFAPIDLVVDGNIKREPLSRLLLVEDDVLSMLRQHGIAEPNGVRLATIEPTGELSVLKVGNGEKGEESGHDRKP